MKIVQVQTQAEAAGAQRVSDMVGEGLRERGHDVRTVFMYRKTTAYDDDPFADFVLRERPRGILGQVRASAGLIAYLRSARPDAVISYQHYGNIFGTIGGRLAGARHIIANQSGAPQRNGVMGLVTRIDKLMGTLGLYQASVVNSAWTEAQFADYPAIYRQRIRRIDHGVASPSRHYDKAAARAAFGLPRDAWLALSSGRLSPDKNQVALVGALKELPDLHVALAGVGPEREPLGTLAERRGVAERLHFVGEVAPSRIFEFLATGDAYVFPSINETFGLAVAEAAIAGLPVVANGLPVLREVLSTEAGEPAALFAENADTAEIARALNELMHKPDLARRLADLGRGLAGRYSPSAMCGGYERLLVGA
ncbi:MAG: glycosyltransferase family 4 protein [Rhizobiaceae bacterium]